MEATTMTEPEQLPSLDGHTVNIRREGPRVVVELRADDAPQPLYHFWTYHNGREATQAIATEMIRVRRAALGEASALQALNEETRYEVRQTGHDAITMTGAPARQLLDQARREAGPELLWAGASPRLSLHHSGAFWHAEIPAYTSSGLRDRLRTRSISICPLVVAWAQQIIAEAIPDTILAPVARPDSRASAAWVRPVADHDNQVIVSRVSSGLHRRPAHSPEGKRWDAWMHAYQDALTTNGWTVVNRATDGWTFAHPTLH
ncbi:hypothetical protein [Streptomyces sp. NPDC059003]|uniref:hypothetical protein n=1 Tax=Streptomyces sp. NPDC059003 TaxID=3346691 RepID=UPI0036B41046